MSTLQTASNRYFLNGAELATVGHAGSRYCFGFNGRVVVASPESHKGQVVIKYFPDPEPKLRATQRRLVLHEGLMLSQLHHPGLVQCRDYGDATVQRQEKTMFQSCCLVTEYLPEGDLHNFIDRYHPLGLSLIHKLFTQLALVLRYLQERYIAHRDIKAANLCLDSNQNVKLIDFGLATYLHAEDSKAQGTEFYLPPEAYDPGPPYSLGPADIFAAGVTLFFICLHAHPFTLPLNSAHTKTLLAAGQTVRFWECFPNAARLDSLTRDLLERMLAIDPIRRPTINEVLGHPFFTTRF